MRKGTAAASVNMIPAIVTEAVERDSQLRRGVWLEYLTIGYNLIEAAVAVVAGVAASSLALIAFGLDSVIEILAAAAVLWRLKRELSGNGSAQLESRALKIVGLTFFALAAYILIEALFDLFTGHEAAVSTVGIILAAASLAIMPALALFKYRVAGRLGSSSLAADSKETLICSYLSLTLLAGLSLNAVFSWPWADTLAAMAMLPLIVREGWEALAGESDG